MPAWRCSGSAATATSWLPKDFARATGATLLPEPYATTIAGRRLALVHGDAQCTDDTGYMAFRAQVRQPQWQREFLAMPLEKRKAIIAGMRDQSRAAQREKSYEIMDVNAQAIAALFEATGAEVLIHGHTHRPARHSYPSASGERLRYVLPDWDCDTRCAARRLDRHDGRWRDPPHRPGRQGNYSTSLLSRSGSNFSSSGKSSQGMPARISASTIFSTCNSWVAALSIRPCSALDSGSSAAAVRP